MSSEEDGRTYAKEAQGQSDNVTSNGHRTRIAVDEEGTDRKWNRQ
jgi:hypothetical protein